MQYNNTILQDYISHLNKNITEIKTIINNNQDFPVSSDIRKAYLDTLNNLQEMKLFLAFQPFSIQGGSHAR